MRHFIDALWSPDGKRLTFWSSFVMSNCEFVFSNWYLGPGVVLLSIPDLCPLSYCSLSIILRIV